MDVKKVKAFVEGKDINHEAGIPWAKEILKSDQ